MTSIDLGGCRSISDIGISAIAEGCHQLTWIYLDGCILISDIGISAIAEGCHHLASVSISECTEIVPEKRSALCLRYPRVEIGPVVIRRNRTTARK